jgi:hypothetical protein
MKKHSADIYSTPEEFQTVLFEFEHIVKKGAMFTDEADTIHVNYLKLNMPLLVDPTDLLTDLQTAIAECLSVSPEQVHITCEVSGVIMPSTTVVERELNARIQFV